MSTTALSDGPETSAPPTRAADRPGTPPHEAGERRGAALFVAAVWLLMAAGAVALVVQFGGRVPFWDDWNWVPMLTGDEAHPLAWLWEPINEHRIPLPKLVLLGLYKLTGNDFRAGMFFNAAALAGLALALALAARAVRGKFEIWDALLPMALLHWGNYEVFFISNSLDMVLPTAIAGVVLLIILGTGRRFSLRAGVAAGVCLLLLPLCGANGLALVPALSLWLAYAGIVRWRSGEERTGRDALTLLGLAGAAVLLIPLYFWNYHKPHYMYDPASVPAWKYVRTALQATAVSLGPAARTFWPWSGVAALGYVATAGLLAWTWWRRPEERLRAAGLFFFLGAVASLIVGIGWGRAPQGDFVGFNSRYGVLTVPALCAAYFAWLLYGPPALGGLPKATLFTAVCALLALNADIGLRYARDYHRQMAAFEADLRGGVPQYLLLRRHGEFLFWSINDRLGPYMQMLHRAGIWPFRALRPDPPFAEVPLSVEPESWDQMKWHDGVGVGDGDDPALVFALPQPRYVAGIRITYAYPDTDGTPLWQFRLYWKGPGQADFGDDRRYFNPFRERAADERSDTIWVGDTVERFHFHPDNARGTVRIKDITLLVPKGGAARR